MATWYTDYIYGNDTTGNGTIAAPYQTIVKAVTVGSSGDTVNVAGTDFTSVTGSLTFTQGSNTVQTSVDMTTTLPIGTVFTVNDPSWGSRKVFFKVSAITATTLNITTVAYLGAVTVSGIEKVTYGSGGLPAYYRTGSTNINFEDLTGINKTDIKIEGGWLNNFTSQTGITWFVYTGSGVSGTALRYTIGQMPGLSLNNIGVAGMTLGTSTANTTTNPQVIGNLWLVHATINLQYQLARKSTGCTWYIGNSCNMNFTSSGSGNANLLQVDTAWWGGGSQLSNNESANLTITNFRVKNTATSATAGAIGYLRYGFINIDNLFIDWTLAANTDQQFVLASDNSGYFTVRNIQNTGNYGGTGKRPIYLRLSSKPQVQLITPTQNADALGIQQLGYILNQGQCFGFQPILDVEGEKQYWGAGSIVYADPGVYDTGTNSLRVNKAVYSGGTAGILVPIKSFYNQNAAGKTVTIRAKASVAGTIKFSLMPSAGITFSNGSTYVPPYLQQFSMTTSWADYQYTIPANVAALGENEYLTMGISIEEWAAQYVWIDSVTIN